MTLFVPLSGRTRCWPQFSAFLENQNVDKDRCRLVLIDTSGRPSFGTKIQSWAKNSDYGEVIYERKIFSRKRSLADFHRLRNFREVNEVMVNIYNYAKNFIRGDTLFVVEDDVIPPSDAYKRLTSSLHADVFSVSAAYVVRGTDKWVVWPDVNEPLSSVRGVGVQQVQANGFGCVVIRANEFMASNLTWSSRQTKDPRWPWGFDMEFFSTRSKKVLVDWNIFCEHLCVPRVNKYVELLNSLR